MAHAVADRLGDGLGLLVDLLEHERLEAALLGAFDVPVQLDEIVLDRRPVDAAERHALGRDRDDVAVGGKVHATRLGQEGGGVRGQERLAVADADDERRLAPRADEQVGMVGVDGDEGEMALHLLVRLRDGLDEVAAVVALDQVRDGLGVGLGGERVPVVLEAGPQLAEVLDDAVEDDGQLGVVAACQRMRVRLRDGAVRRPARVPESGDRGRGVVAGGALLQLGQGADGAGVLERAVGEQRDPRRVVAPIFEALQPGQQQVLARPPADVPDDPAHMFRPPPVSRSTPESTTSPAPPPASSQAVNRAQCSRAPRWYHRASWLLPHFRPLQAL